MPRPSKNFLFCVHAHQPVGNFGHVFEEAFERCYRPFFEVLEGHPNFPVSVHFSGSLIDWLEVHRPSFLSRLRGMGEEGRIEFLGGAYYEPIYGLIPPKDLEAQIAMTRAKVKHLFGQSPEGVWLTERVWEPRLVGALRKAGVKYTILDDTHFENAGHEGPVSAGYYRARKGFSTLDVFASHQTLRYLMPFRPAEEAWEHLRGYGRAEEGEQTLVFADDLEKFGLWPGTHDWVYGQKWLDRFLTLVGTDRSIKLDTFSGFRRAKKPGATMKVPHASYSEMMEWSGGRFDNFFKKYPESAYMKERMQSVSARLAKKNASLNGHGDAARRALYQAQCNCPYWHGVFGGLYLHHLRSSVYENLIRAEGHMAEGEPAGPFRERFDSGERWGMRQPKIVSYFNPSYGAALEELDFLPKPANLVCTIQRRPESYHAVAAGAPEGSEGASALHQILGMKEEGLEHRLFYDNYRRLCFLDHFFERPIDRADHDRSSYQDAGDFADGAWKASRKGAQIRFERTGQVMLGGKKRALRVEKTVSAKGERAVEVRYEFTNPGREAMALVFAPEFNFSIGLSPAQPQELAVASRYVFRDSWRGLEIQWDSDVSGKLFMVPVETVSESEGGLERTYQQLSALFQRELTLAPGASCRIAMSLEVRG